MTYKVTTELGTVDVEWEEISGELPADGADEFHRILKETANRKINDDE